MTCAFTICTHDSLINGSRMHFSVTDVDCPSFDQESLFTVAAAAVAAATVKVKVAAPATHRVECIVLEINLTRVQRDLARWSFHTVHLTHRVLYFFHSLARSFSFTYHSLAHSRSSSFNSSLSLSLSLSLSSPLIHKSFAPFSGRDS